jgi:hypothetical protein
MTLLCCAEVSTTVAVVESGRDSGTTMLACCELRIDVGLLPLGREIASANIVAATAANRRNILGFMKTYVRSLSLLLQQKANMRLLNKKMKALQRQRARRSK